MSSVTNAGEIVGTIAYLSPERFLGKIAGFLGCLNLGLSLFKSELRVANVEANAFLLLLGRNLALAVLQHGAELIGLGLPVAQIDGKCHPDLVFRRRVIECVHEHAGEVRG